MTTSKHTQPAPDIPLIRLAARDMDSLEYMAAFVAERYHWLDDEQLRHRVEIGIARGRARAAEQEEQRAAAADGDDR